MKTLVVRINTLEAAGQTFVEALRSAQAGNGNPVKRLHSIGFVSYAAMHRVLSPARLDIVRTMAGQGPLSIREVARRVERDFKAVHTDVTMLVNAGVIDRDDGEIVFPYDRIHFEFDIEVAA
jgi:predicted transcriptional regulator